ncbi:MAG: hypothetical protein JNK15_11765, partial [Planctomycetes bacterium]|nr:hypothetical protein [Planctomycetota bacterium]
MWCLELDRTGTLWVGTLQGACWLDGVRFVPFSLPEGAPDPNQGVSSARMVRAITEDRAGRIWFGTNRGGSRSSALSLAMPSVTKEDGGGDGGDGGREVAGGGPTTPPGETPTIAVAALSGNSSPRRQRLQPRLPERDLLGAHGLGDRNVRPRVEVDDALHRFVHAEARRWRHRLGARQQGFGTADEQWLRFGEALLAEQHRAERRMRRRQPPAVGVLRAAHRH